jgi:hypothetical protein
MVSPSFQENESFNTGVFLLICCIVIASPGRWYASYTLKQAVVHLLINYDFKLGDEKQERTFFWTTAIVPRFGTRLMLKKRESSSVIISN